MTGREFLQQIRHLKLRVRSLEDELKTVQQSIDGLSGMCYDRDRVDGGVIIRRRKMPGAGQRNRFTFLVGTPEGYPDAAGYKKDGADMNHRQILFLLVAFN